MGRRELLLDLAREIVERDGPAALKARALCEAAGVSTIAVYNEFGGMPELFDSLIRQSFTTLGAVLSQVPSTVDPVTDLLSLGLAYRSFASAHPHLYRLMFGAAVQRATSPGMARDLTAAGHPTAFPEPNAAFEHLVQAVARAMEVGRIRPDSVASVGGQIWSALHGFVMLETVGFFGTEPNGVSKILTPMITNLLIGLGDTRASIVHSASNIALAPRADAHPRSRRLH